MTYHLPRGYLSYTQYNLWNSNEDLYRMSYYTEEQGFSGSKYTAYGTEVHRMVQEGKHPFTNMPEFEISEQKIEVDVDGVPLLSFIDGFSPNTGTIFELKTGKHPWTQARVNNHDQLVFYALAVHEKYGFHDPNVTLVWMQTADVPCIVEIDGLTWDSTKPEITGHIEIFKREIGDREIANFREHVVRTAREIHEDYERFRSSLILE